MNKPLSNYDLIGGIMKEMKERGNIFDMRDIDHVSTIEDIFKGKGHVILFEPNENPNEEVGHWTCMVRNQRNGKNIIYFDSYGDPLKNTRMKQILGTHYKQLEFNPHQFQDYGKSATCGRFGLLVVALNKIIKDLSVIDVVNFLISKPKRKSFDEFVYDLTKDIKAKKG